ncbi:MAG: hypothetical protein QM529_03355 [Hydrotalea sp.]|nr:hypothetical protein [Hydrotalea sp.]
MLSNQPIVIRDLNTWPIEVKEFLAAHEELLVDEKIIKIELEQIDKESNGSPSNASMIAEQNELPSAKIINNIYKKYGGKEQFNICRDKFKTDLVNILQKHSFLLVHYTRLTEYEIGDILNSGLSLPNSAVLATRIDKLVEQKYLTEEQANHLKKYNAYTDANERKRRENIFCFVSGDPLEGETDNSKCPDYGRLVKCWGGEALYCGNEELVIGQTLRKIGIPSIIEAVIPCSILCNVDLGRQAVDRFVNRHLKSKKIIYKNDKLFTEYEEYQDGYGCQTKEDITNEDMKKINILRIIRYDKDREEFIRFTGCDKWDEQLI